MMTSDACAPSASHVLADDARCPCLSGETYGACCGRLHRGEAQAPTAERLMRSRFSAFAVGDAAYLLATWHPRTRPVSFELDSDVRWTRLDILNTKGGGMLNTDGTVEFRAHFRAHSRGGAVGSQHEVSRFIREGGRWFYLDGAVS